MYEDWYSQQTGIVQHLSDFSNFPYHIIWYVQPVVEGLNSNITELITGVDKDDNFYCIDG